MLGCSITLVFSSPNNPRLSTHRYLWGHATYSYNLPRLAFVLGTLEETSWTWRNCLSRTTILFGIWVWIIKCFDTLRFDKSASWCMVRTTSFKLKFNWTNPTLERINRNEHVWNLYTGQQKRAWSSKSFLQTYSLISCKSFWRGGQTIICATFWWVNLLVVLIVSCL